MMIPKDARPLADPRSSRVILTRDLLALGYDDRAIARMVKDGQLVKVRRGAHVEAAAWAKLDEAGRHGIRARAVLRQACTEVVLSHVSGLPEYDAPTWGLDLSRVHVTRPDERAGRIGAGVRQHCGKIVDGDVIELNGVPVMNATRLALEVTTVALTEPSLVVVNHLLRLGYTSPELLEKRYASIERWPNSLRTNIVLRLADGRMESVGETRTFYMCHRQGLPMPVPQLAIEDEHGHVVARVDFAWPELGVFLEFDGKVKYEKLLRDGERASDVVIREKRREELICRLTGWRCIRITWADLEHPERTAALIRTILFADPRR